MTKAIMIQGCRIECRQIRFGGRDLPRVGQTRPSTGTVQAAKYVQ